MLATQYAQWHGISPQQDGESDSAFQNRVSGELRNQGAVIEAHEVAQDKRWDDEDGEMVQAGIAGAIAMAMLGRNYGRSGSSLVEDEIAAGVVAQAPKKDNSALLMLMALMLRD